MTPKNIVQESVCNGLSIIAITDHNTTRNVKYVKKAAQNTNLIVIGGAEISTKEEVHCLTLFSTEEYLNEFQNYIDQYLPKIKNNPDLFGYQVIADEHNNIVYEEKYSLLSSLNQSIEQVATVVKKLKGIFIPAHIDKPKNSIISQLGFIDTSLEYHALGVSPHFQKKHFLKKYPYLKKQNFIQNSDAHYLQDIGKVRSYWQTNKNFDFKVFKKAIAKGEVYIK